MRWPSLGWPGLLGRHRWLRRVLVALVSAIVVVLTGMVLLGELTPSVRDAETRVQELAAKDGAVQDPSPVPRVFAESIVASEDSRFYTNGGVDVLGTGRAAWMALTGRGGGGGATISQQLAKLLYTGGRGGLFDDVEHVVLAVKLNHRYSKTQILQMYADTVYFGHGYYGLDRAACGYFDLPPEDLSLAQASLLAGIVQAPSAYDPLKHLSLARSRQGYVLDRLVATGQISVTLAHATAHAELGLTTRSAPACQ